jgi:hypothetical protein
MPRTCQLTVLAMSHHSVPSVRLGQGAWHDKPQDHLKGVFRRRYTQTTRPQNRPQGHF